MLLNNESDILPPWNHNTPLPGTYNKKSQNVKISINKFKLFPFLRVLHRPIVFKKTNATRNMDIFDFCDHYKKNGHYLV